MKFKTKGISLLLSIAMLLSMFPATSFALNLGNTEFIKPGTTEANMPEMKTVAVKVNSADNGYDIISGTDGKLTTPLEKDDTIIVAIQANNFDQFVQNSFGVQELSVALVYDTRYLEPTSTTNKKYITASKNFLAKDETNFMNQEIDGMYMVDTSTAKYAQDLASGETSILDSDTSNLKKAVLYVTCTPNSATDVNEQLGVITAGQLINFVEFKVKEVPDAGSKGVAITESSNLCLVMQNTGIFNKTWGGIDGLQEYMKINNSLNLFPAGAAKKTGISVKSGTMASTQVVGDVFKPGVNLQFDYNDGSHTDLGTSDTVTYKYGAAGITAADNAGLTAIPATLTNDVNGKHIYAIVGNFICDLGELTVSEIKITEITVSGAPTTAYDGTAINFNNLVATIEKNNGASVGNIKFTNYENVSNDLAIYKSNADGDVLAQVTASDTYTHGVNYFVVAVKSDRTVKSAVFTVTSNYDDITITKDTNAKTLYNKGDKFDPSAIAVKAKKASETGEGTKVSYADFDGNYKVVIATSAEAAKTATAVDANTDITEAMLDGTHNVYVVYTNASGTQSVAEVGTLGAKKITGGSLTGCKTAYTYGDKFDTTVKFTPTYDDGSTGTEISFDKLSAAGITVKIGDTVVTADTVITPAMKDKTVDFVYDSSKAPVKSNKITVAKKTIKYSVSNTPITKEYDGNTDAPSSISLPAITREALVGADTCDLTGTFAFTDKNAGTNKDVKLTINESTLSEDIKNKYSFVPDGTTVLANGVLAAKAEITKKALTLNAGVITGLSTKVDPNATADVTKDGSLVLTKDNSNLVDGDNVTVPYTYTFTANDVKTAGNDKDVTIALKDLTGADKDNYTFDKTQVTTAKGNVTQEAFSDIEISGPTKVTYTYPELTPDLSDLVVNAVYGTGTSAIKVPVTNYTLTKKDGTTFKPAEPLPYGDTEVTITYKGKTKTITLTAKKKPIKLSDIIFKPESKSYDGTTTATGTATVKEGVTVAGDTVNISAKWEFDGKDVGTNTIKVSDIKADNENYEIVGEDNLPVSSTTINNSTAVIKPATPENVTAKADKKTNNIVLSGTTADFEYSTDNGATWVKATAGTTTIENAVRNKEYTILVRTAATTSAPASDSATVKATTYKYLVNIYKNGAAAGSEPEYKVYTNDEEINAVKDDTTFGKFNSNVLQYTPSRFSAYFTDSACTTSADVANLPKDSNDNINLYYTAKKSSGGGGGGGRSVSIKLDKDTVSGVVGDKIKVTATVTGSTAKPTWTSSNEDVATVDENGNITFVGKGTATVKVKVNGVVKNIPVTVKEATATPTPVPTVKPTEAPVINTEYTKPYASGYDDGSFLPNNNITRGELAAMIARLSYGDDLPDGMYQASFPDVDSDAWFNKYIGYLEDKDVLSGYEDGTFRPMDTITRGEISAVIARAQRYDLISYNGIFTDVTENDWAKDYIETLADKNIVSGYEDGTFGPYSPLTRAEAVAIINRVLVESTPIVTFTPNDIAGHWAEADILLAVNERMVGANAVVPTVKPEETAAPEETVAPETTVTPEETVAPEKTTAPEATPAA